MRIAVIGAGFTGLTAAYRLSQKGHQVIVFEKEKSAGGLTSGFRQKRWAWFLENFFHHLFTDDTAAQKLITDLGLENKLFYIRPKTSIFLNNQITQFDSPFSILKFPFLSSPQRLQTGLITAYLRFGTSWKELEKAPAYQWLKKYYGPGAYRVLWEPLLKAKFGKEFKTISMAWFWARIKKRSFKLGYLKGGFQILIDQLVKEIKKNHGQINLGQEVTNYQALMKGKEFDRIIFTTPFSVFSKIMGPKLSPSYQQRLKPLKMIGAMNLILVLKEKFLTDGTYWLNINEKGLPFVAVVEQTNLINPKHYGGDHLLYVGGYFPQNHPYFKTNKEKILKDFLPGLKKINPRFNQSWLKGYRQYACRFAQPIVPVNYSKLIPRIKTPVNNVYLTNMQMVYPWDRGVNFAIEKGEAVVNEVLKKI